MTARHKWISTVKGDFPLIGRPGRGGNRRLLDEDVRTIRRLSRDEGLTARAIALNYPGLATETIRKVIRGETFRDVSDFPLEEEADLSREGVEAQMKMIRAAEALRQRNAATERLMEEARRELPPPAADPLEE